MLNDKLKKVKRIVNKKLLKSFQDLPCAACGMRYEVYGHHRKTRGAGGDDVESNLIPLCMKHHTQVHLWGEEKMAIRYPSFASYIKRLTSV